MLTINNAPTQDAYVPDLTLESMRAGGRLAYVVANASVLCQLRPLYDPSSAAAEFGPEFLLTPQSGVFDAVSGIRFRSAIAGAPAQIIAQLFERGDPIPVGGTPFLQLVTASGAVSGGSTGGLLNIQYFTVAGTDTYFPSSPSVASIVVEVIGGGGGGGGVGPSGSAASATGGGGAGGFARVRITGTKLIQSGAGLGLTVGAGGAGGAATGGNGGTGGSSLIHGAGPPLGEASGGAGALGTNAAGVQTQGGLGGLGVNGDLLEDGGDGGAGANAGGGLGGASFQGGGGAGGAAAAGQPGRAAGSGGGGANALSHAGGAGAVGLVVVYEYA